MRFTNVLNDILASKSKIKTLRYLLNSKLELTGRQLARVVNIHHRTCHDALKELASYGIVVMRETGKAIGYKINDNNLIVTEILRPIFTLEKNLLAQVTYSLLKDIPIRVISVIVFGSVASSLERGTSDVDVLFLVSSREEQNKLTKALEKLEYEFILKYGNMLSPLVFTLSELDRRLKRKDRLVLNIIQKGKSVYGKTIQEVLNAYQRRRYSTRASQSRNTRST